jgi:hypothetical protein
VRAYKKRGSTKISIVRQIKEILTDTVGRTEKSQFVDRVGLQKAGEWSKNDFKRQWEISSEGEDIGTGRGQQSTSLSRNKVGHDTILSLAHHSPIRLSVSKPPMVEFSIGASVEFRNHRLLLLFLSVL